METKIVYFDETGDDGLNTKSSDTFILTSVYMPCGSWQDNYNIIRAFRCNLDKTRITIKNYHILENALTYNVQRIENDSHGDWNFLLITDKGRIAPMRKTARAIRAFNPIHSQFGGYINKPIKNMIEDVLEKDSMESLTKRPAPKNMDWSSTLRNKNTTYDVFTFSVVQFDCPIKFLVCQRFALL